MREALLACLEHLAGQVEELVGLARGMLVGVEDKPHEHGDCEREHDAGEQLEGGTADIERGVDELRNARRDDDNRKRDEVEHLVLCTGKAHAAILSACAGFAEQSDKTGTAAPPLYEKGELLDDEEDSANG